MNNVLLWPANICLYFCKLGVSMCVKTVEANITQSSIRTRDIFIENILSTF